ncbi:SDR family oxidoreductase [Pyrococcus woesei]|uniref:SDR family oxidoreductase n=1 Tax=Pyrococcus woesei TaxID=2262 RepID=UPI000748B5CF|nr:MAG: alcohol dehydrogenase [Thermococcales archaeon 44_46]MBC7108889.1 SDR family oxidoreductase [Methanomassiliicoccales archaeon]
MKVAVVTGASKGIGRAIAKALAKEGYKLALGARSVEMLEELSREIGGAFYSYLDVSKPESVAEFAEKVLKEFGGVDLLVANAGIPMGGRLDEVSEEDMKRVFDVNTFGVWRTIKAFLPSLKERKGTVVVVTSYISTMILPNAGPYVASKWAARAITKTFQLENPEVKFIELRPGKVDTYFYGKPGRKIEEGFMKPEDVAELLISLLKLPEHVLVEDVLFRSIY